MILTTCLVSLIKRTQTHQKADHTHRPREIEIQNHSQEILILKIIPTATEYLHLLLRLPKEITSGLLDSLSLKNSRAQIDAGMRTVFLSCWSSSLAARLQSTLSTLPAVKTHQILQLCPCLQNIGLAQVILLTPRRRCLLHHLHRKEKKKRNRNLKKIRESRLMLRVSLLTSILGLLSDNMFQLLRKHQILILLIFSSCSMIDKLPHAHDLSWLQKRISFSKRIIFGILSTKYYVMWKLLFGLKFNLVFENVIVFVHKLGIAKLKFNIAF